MIVDINGAALNVEVLGRDDAPVLIAHHGGGGIGSLAEPRTTFGPLAGLFRSHGQSTADVDGLHQWARSEKIVVAGDSYGEFIAMECYPDRVLVIVLHDTSPTPLRWCWPTRTPPTRAAWSCPRRTSTGT